MKRINILLVSSALAVVGPAAYSPAESSPETWAQWRASELDSTLERTVDAYLKVGRRDPAWDDDAQEFLTKMADWWSSQWVKTDLLTLRDLGQELIDAGCDDPLVLYAMGYIWEHLDQDWTAKQYLERAVEGLDASEYPARRLAAAAGRYARYLNNWGRSQDEVDAQWRRCVNAYLTAIRRGEYEGEVDSLIAALLPRVRRRMPAEHAERLVEGLNELSDQIEPYALHSILGQYEIRLAWDARGGGYADTVTEEGWRLFREHMSAANDHLVRAWELNPQRPWAAVSMIAVTMAGGASDDTNERIWFERALAAWPDWTFAHQAYLWSLRPRWGGSHQQMLELGFESARDADYSTRTPRVLISSILAVADDLSDDDRDASEVWRMPGVYEKADEVLNRLAAHPNHADDVEWFKTVRVIAAWATDRYERAAPIVHELDLRLHRDAFLHARLQTPAHRIVEEVVLYGSASSKLARKAEELEEKGEYARAVKVYEGIADSADNDEALRRVALSRAESARISAGLRSREWVDLRFDKHLSGWSNRGGAWRAIDERTVEGEIGWDEMNEKSFWLYCDAPLGGRFELQGELDLEDLTGWNWHNAGVIFNFNWSESRWQSVLFFPEKDLVAARYKYKSGELHPCEHDRRLDFHLRVLDDEVEITVDGRRIYSGEFDGPKDWERGATFGFGGKVYNLYGKVRYSNLRVRSLAVEAPFEKSAPY